MRSWRPLSTTAHEGRVVVVVDGDGLAWIDQFDDFHSLTGIHSDHESEDSRSAQVYQGKIDVMVTSWDIFQLIIVEYVAADVEPYQHVSCSVLKFEHAAYDLWQEGRKAARCMPTRHGGDTECAISSMSLMRPSCYV